MLFHTFSLIQHSNMIHTAQGKSVGNHSIFNLMSQAHAWLNQVDVLGAWLNQVDILGAWLNQVDILGTSWYLRHKLIY